MAIAAFVMSLVALTINGLMWLFVILEAYEECKDKRQQRHSTACPKTSSDCDGGGSNDTKNLDKFVE